MFLKIIFILAILYGLYRLFGGSFKLPTANKEKKEIEQNTLVECCKCGVYITKKEAKKKGECYYCEDCA